MVVLVTNNHMLENLEQARDASYQFGYHFDNGSWEPKKINGEDLVAEDETLFFTDHRTCVSVAKCM